MVKPKIENIGIDSTRKSLNCFNIIGHENAQLVNPGLKSHLHDIKPSKIEKFNPSFNNKQEKSKHKNQDKKFLDFKNQNLRYSSNEE